MLVVSVVFAHAVRAEPADRSVFLVLVDGLRWQEVFSGAEAELMTKQMGKVEDADKLKAAYWRDTAEARRELLMPFFWKTVAKQGQLFGNQRKGSIAQVSNSRRVSYPGYSEMIVGFADPNIKDNAKIPNPNVSVFEWLHGRPGFKDRVAVIAAWDVVPFIVNRDRCGFYVNAACEPITTGEVSPRQSLLNDLKRDTPCRWGVEPFDSLVFHAALEYIKANTPRAMWLTFGETDEWGHEGRYAEYLDATLRTDRFLAQLWNTLQSMPAYKDKSTLIVVADHGRGNGLDWANHNATTAGAENIWLAIIGPDTPALGERAESSGIIQAQVAATVAAAVGEDFRAAVAKAAPPIESAIKRSRR